MISHLNDIWQTLSKTPLIGLLLTLIAYRLGVKIYQKSGYKDWCNSVMITLILLSLVLWATGISYERYFASAQFIHFLLGPATVALAIPLFASWHRLKSMAAPLIVALLAGVIATSASALLIAYFLGASKETLLSLTTKSITTPIAMGIAEKIGGVPSLAAVMVLLTGVLGTIAFPPFFKMLNIKDHAVQGFAVGLTAHGLGTARAFQLSDEAGAFAALAMGMNGVLTAFLLPMLLPLFW